MKNHNFKNPYLPELLFYAIFNFFKRMPVNFMAINYAVAHYWTFLIQGWDRIFNNLTTWFKNRTKEKQIAVS